MQDLILKWQCCIFGEVKFHIFLWKLYRRRPWIIENTVCRSKEYSCLLRTSNSFCSVENHLLTLFLFRFFTFFYLPKPVSLFEHEKILKVAYYMKYPSFICVRWPTDTIRINSLPLEWSRFMMPTTLEKARTW